MNIKPDNGPKRRHERLQARQITKEKYIHIKIISFRITLQAINLVRKYINFGKVQIIYPVYKKMPRNEY